ncbi:hypothetical protein ACIQF6_12420 [Kitasatospora sp. NPDC092948]|uniref:hypothetical protein n=1 Tax=Kitasatospora sp. NPDC092948 TaxID=3364088 RepID=UPI003822428B
MRSRRCYALIALACLVLAIGSATVGAATAERNIGWLHTVCVLGCGGGLGIGLVMFARAVLPDRLRRHAFPQGRLPDDRD